MVKNSKYKHIFTEEPKQEQIYRDMPPANDSRNSSNICASAKYFFYSKNGPNQGTIMKLGNPHRVSDLKKVSPGHAGKITEAAFCPHDDGMLATGGQDGKVCILKFNDEDFDDNGCLKEDKVDVWAECDVGRKDVLSMAWNPSVGGLLAVGSKNKEIHFFDAAGSGAAAFDSIGPFDDIPLSMCWSYDGKYLCFTISDPKNHRLFVWDPRKGEAVMEKETKVKGTSQVFWAGKLGYVGVVGNRADTNKRICKLYDPATGKLVCKSEDLPSGNSVLKPMFDSSRNMLWVYGKGGSSINFQVVDVHKEKVTLKSLGNGRSASVIKGGCFINMRGCDVMNCESQRFIAILQKNGVIAPYKFIIPRKNMTTFHDDVFPDVPHKIPSLTISQFKELGADDEMPARKMFCLDPDKKQNEDGEFVFEKKATYDELEKNYNALLEIVKANQEKLAGVDLSQFLES